MIRSIFIYVLLELVFLVSCSLVDDQDCSFADNSRAVIGDINVRNVDFKSYNSIQIIDAGDSIEFNKHALWLDVNPAFAASRKTTSRSLFACSPPEPQLLDKISSIKVFTIYALNDSIDASQEITEQVNFISEDNEEVSLSNIQVLNDHFRSYFYIFLNPTIPPVNSGNVAYRIELQIESGNFYELTSEPIFIL